MKREELQALLDKRAQLWEGEAKDLRTQIKSAIDAGDDETYNELEERWDKLEGDLGRLDKAIEREQSAIERDAELAKVQARTVEDTPAARAREALVEEHDTGGKRQNVDIDDALRRFVNGGIGGLTPEQRTILDAGTTGTGRPYIDIELPSWRDRVAQLRAQSVAVAGEGGNLIPQGFFNRLTESMQAWGGMREVATILTTASGNDLPMPTVDDTGNSGAILSENVEVDEQDFTFSKVTLQAYKYTSKLVRVSMELMQDSAFDLPGYIGNALGVRLGRATNAHFTTGTGSSQPNGIVTASNAGVTTASATAFTYAELQDLEHSVDPAYRRNALFMFNDSTLKKIRQLSTGIATPLWQPSISIGVPSSIDGYRYVVNQDVASVATTTKPIIFGDLSQYYIRDVAGIRLVRLDERFAEFDQVGFVAFLRTDGDLLDAGDDPLKHMLMA